MADAYTGKKLEVVSFWLRQEFNRLHPNEAPTKAKLYAILDGVPGDPNRPGYPKTPEYVVEPPPIGADAFDDLRERLAMAATAGGWFLAAPGMTPQGTPAPMSPIERQKVKTHISNLPIDAIALLMQGAQAPQVKD